MTWNYRICKETRKWETSNDSGETVEYSIREAYYNKAGEVQFVTVEAKVLLADLCEFTCSNEAECVESLKTQLEMMTLALSKPVLDIDTIVFADVDDVEVEDTEWAEGYANGCVDDLD